MKETVSFDEFNKLDLRISQIISAEKVAKANKLPNLEVNTRLDLRDIVSGIAEHFAPEELPAKKVVVLINLEPREIKGGARNAFACRKARWQACFRYL